MTTPPTPPAPLPPSARDVTIGPCRLICADALQVMPGLPSVDTILTDPVWPNAPANSVAGSNDPWALWSDACASMPETKRTIVVMRCDSDPRFLQTVKGKFFRSMQLPYVMPGYLGRVLGGDETAYWFGDPIKWADGRRVVPGRGPRVQPGGRSANDHPMSRAQQHFDWLVHWCSDDDELVLDPFMGSGTTGVSCVKMGRRFIGIEIDPGFFDIACRRIQETVDQPSLFTPAGRAALRAMEGKDNATP